MLSQLLRSRAGKVSTRAATGGALGVLAVAAAIALPDIKRWEGLRTTPYADKLAYGLPTVCYGETRVQMRRYTPAECEALAVKALTEDFGPAAIACVPGLAERPHQLAASMLLSYNIGSRAFCRSTVARRFNAGDWRAGCDGFLAWRFAGGKEVRGLLNRRRHERELCLKGL